MNLKNNKHQPNLITAFTKMTRRAHTPILIVPGEQYLSRKQGLQVLFCNHFNFLLSKCGEVEIKLQIVGDLDSSEIPNRMDTGFHPIPLVTYGRSGRVPDQ